jgi:hypothetical protein
MSNAPAAAVASSSGVVARDHVVPVGVGAGGLAIKPDIYRLTPRHVSITLAAESGHDASCLTGGGSSGLHRRVAGGAARSTFLRGCNGGTGCGGFEDGACSGLGPGCGVDTNISESFIVAFV